MRKADLVPLNEMADGLRLIATPVYARHQDASCTGCAEPIVFDPLSTPLGPPKLCTRCFAEAVQRTTH